MTFRYFGSSFLLDEVFNDRGDEAGDIVFVGFKCRRRVVFAQGFAGDRADTAGDTTLWPFEAEREKVIRCGAGGEGDQIRALLGEAGLRTGGVASFGHGAVSDAFVDDRAELDESVADDFAGLGGLDPEYGQVFDV